MSLPETESEKVGIARHGSALHVELRRPAALNALDLPMIERLAGALALARADDGVATLLLAGSGERAFCAGGDIRAIHRGLAEGRDVASPFWRREYDLLVEIERFAKPVVVLMDRIVMGGGLGLAMHASHRIVTERTRAAMPEVGIGFLPDVGATWRLPKAPDFVGHWMALTGESFGPADAILAGLADSAVASGDLGALRDALAGLPAGAGRAEVDGVIGRYRIEPEAGRLSSQRRLLADTFGAPTLDGVIERLGAADDPFSRETLATIRSRSPMSLHVTRRLLDLGAASPDLAHCLDREFDAAVRVMHQPDFAEGVRAAVIDKDRHPRWQAWTADDAAEWDVFLDRAGTQARTGGPR